MVKSFVKGEKILNGRMRMFGSYDTCVSIGVQTWNDTLRWALGLLPSCSIVVSIALMSYCNVHVAEVILWGFFFLAVGPVRIP